MTHLRQLAAGLRHLPSTVFWLAVACAAASASARLARFASDADHRADAHEALLHEATGMTARRKDAR